MSDHALSGEQRTKCYKLIRILNIVSSYSILLFRIAIIGFGLAGLIFMAIINILSLKFFLVFSPIFMMFYISISIGSLESYFLQLNADSNLF